MGLRIPALVDCAFNPLLFSGLRSVQPLPAPLWSLGLTGVRRVQSLPKHNQSTGLRVW